MNTDININTILCTKITELRKSAGLTQDALAEKLGVTFQAVSKWENALSCPDISLLPRIAEIFDVSIDTLFGLKPKDPEPKAVQKEKNDRLLDWPDDGKLRAVLFIGNRITGKNEYTEEKSTITLEYDGDALDIISDFSVKCGDVKGDVTTANGSISCGDVGGDAATANGAIDCSDVGGDATTANGHIDCGNVGGDAATRNGAIDCGDVDGDVTTTNGSVNCGDVGGCVTIKDASGAATIQCGDVEGDVSISGGNGNGTVTVSGDVGGNITARTVIRE